MSKGKRQVIAASAVLVFLGSAWTAIKAAVTLNAPFPGVAVALMVVCVIVVIGADPMVDY